MSVWDVWTYRHEGQQHDSYPAKAISFKDAVELAWDEVTRRNEALIEAHGGTIGFDSIEGCGTTFRVNPPGPDAWE
ncbi:MAG: hypothetical protein ACYDA3_05345 [Gaiellaceae bacterium]